MRLLMLAVRVGLPAAIAIAGIVLIVVGHGRTHGTGATSLGNSLAAGGVALLIVAMIVWMLGWMFRMSVDSNRERDEEEAARRYFDEHGRWPDEEPRA
jgi:membrane protein implicated in regulation of membrane protease activity